MLDKMKTVDLPTLKISKVKPSFQITKIPRGITILAYDN